MRHTHVAQKDADLRIVFVSFSILCQSCGLRSLCFSVKDFQMTTTICDFGYIAYLNGGAIVE